MHQQGCDLPKKIASQFSGNRRNQALVFSLLSNLRSTPAPYDFPPSSLSNYFQSYFSYPQILPSLPAVLIQSGSKTFLQTRSSTSYRRRPVFQALQHITALKFGETNQVVTATTPVSPRPRREQRGQGTVPFGTPPHAAPAPAKAEPKAPSRRFKTTHPRSAFISSYQTLLLFPEPSPRFRTRSQHNSKVFKQLRSLPSRTTLKVRPITTQNK